MIFLIDQDFGGKSHVFFFQGSEKHVQYLAEEYPMTNYFFAELVPAEV